MSRSLDFCKARAANPNFSTFYDRDWESAVEIECTEAWFDKCCLHGHHDYITDMGYEIHITFDPNANFDYFTFAASVHDGTSLFTVENMLHVAKKVCTGATYLSTMGEPQPGDKIYYTIGNIIALQEFGNYGDKPWLTERDTILLPIKYSRARN